MEAVIMIDMQNGFINKASSLCVRDAEKTVPVCAKVLSEARAAGKMVVIVNRRYREDGVDVEKTRQEVWERGGRPLTPGSTGSISEENPASLAPQASDYVVIKPRFSAFFHTELDLLLRRKRIEKIYLMGTTTPNCIRTTCYDGLSLDYDVAVIEDACSSNTDEIQRVNMEDMKRVGAKILSAEQVITSCKAAGSAAAGAAQEQKGSESYDPVAKQVACEMLLRGLSPDMIAAATGVPYPVLMELKRQIED